VLGMSRSVPDRPVPPDADLRLKPLEITADCQRVNGHERYRLVTRSDFDGLVSAVLLRHLDMIDDILFAHPKDVQDGVTEITDRDIITNLPYAAQARLVFDHHHSELLRAGTVAKNHIIDVWAPSAARVVHRHYGGAWAFPSVSEEVMSAVDRADSADFELDDILYPTDWALLSFIMDSRTGLGRFRDFRISNYQLMMRLIDLVFEQVPVEKILADPDVAERVDLFRRQHAAAAEQLRQVASVRGDVVVLDFRAVPEIHACNRFLVYALFPDLQVSVHVLPGKQGANTVIAAGKSIIDRQSNADIGRLMLGYGGGGHRNAGTCQVAHGGVSRVLDEIVDALNEPARLRYG